MRAVIGVILLVISAVPLWAAAKKVPLIRSGVLNLDNRDTSFGVKVVANGHWKLVKNEIHITITDGMVASSKNCPYQGRRK